MCANPFIEKIAAILNKDGFHIRPAVAVARIAKEAKGQIFIEKDGKRAAADSVTDLLMLNCQKNDFITLLADNEADEPLLMEIKTLLAMDEIRI